MNTVEGIRKLRDYFFNDLYTGVRGQQREDDTFYKDTFTVPQIRNPARIQRTGRASRLIDSPKEHIITSNPQLFRDTVGTKKGAEDSSLNVSREGNRWIQIMKRQNPNPFKEFVGNLLLPGEGWIQTLHNERWVTKPIERKGLPVLFLIPNPQIIYADPNEDENGVPERVIIFYESVPWLIKAKYPNWSNPKNVGEEGAEKKTVTRLGYIDRDIIYFEADEEPLLKGGIQKNIYGFVPFVHKLSGFGKSSPEGKMEDLIVGRLRNVRDILKRECAIVSDIDSTFHLYANRSIDVQPIDDQHSIPTDFAQKYEFGPGMVHELPYGIRVEKAVELLPSQEIFQYLYSIGAQLEREDPLVMAGAPVGASGRLQDIVGASAMRRYDTIVENTQYAFETAFGQALRILEKVPTLMPTGLSKEDIGGFYEVKIELKAADPIEADRKATLGSRLYQQGEIDLRTNLIKYQGYSQDEADEIINNILVDKVTIQSPIVAEFMGMKLAEKLGATEVLEAMKAKRQGLEAQQKGLGGVEGEVETETGREMPDESLRGRGMRTPPARV